MHMEKKEELTIEKYGEMQPKCASLVSKSLLPIFKMILDCKNSPISYAVCLRDIITVYDSIPGSENFVSCSDRLCGCKPNSTFGFCHLDIHNDNIRLNIIRILIMKMFSFAIYKSMGKNKHGSISIFGGWIPDLLTGVFPRDLDILVSRQFNEIDYRYDEYIPKIHNNLKEILFDLNLFLNLSNINIQINADNPPIMKSKKLYRYDKPVAQLTQYFKININSINTKISFKTDIVQLTKCHIECFHSLHETFSIPVIEFEGSTIILNPNKFCNINLKSALEIVKCNMSTFLMPAKYKHIDLMFRQNIKYITAKYFDKKSYFWNIFSNNVYLFTKMYMRAKKSRRKYISSHRYGLSVIEIFAELYKNPHLMIQIYFSKMIKLDVIKRPYKRFRISDRKIVKKLEIIFMELHNMLMNSEIEPDYNLDIFNMTDDGDIVKACQYILYIERLFNEF